MDHASGMSRSELAGLIRRHDLFADLSEGVIASLISECRIVSFSQGEALLRQGEDSDSALLLFEGAIDIVAETEIGSAVLAELSGICLLGEIGVFARLPRSATLRATTPARALCFDRTVMLRLCHDHPPLPLRVIQQLAGRLNAFNQAIATYADALSAMDTNSDDSRIIDALLTPPPELTNFAIAFRKMATLIKQQRRQREEMASASAIQNALLPFPLPVDSRDRFRLDAIIKPAQHVGGDFFDAFMLGPSEIVVTMGDVSGKGVPASLFATVCQMVMRLVLCEPTGLGEAVSKANDLIVSANREGMFATFFVARLDLRDGSLSFCDAGHVWPIIQRAGGGIDYLRGQNLPLAVEDEAAYSEEHARLHPGDRLVLYTDGILEAASADGREFGPESLAATLVDLRDERTSLAQRLIAAVDAFATGAEQFDDMACQFLDYPGADGPAGRDAR